MRRALGACGKERRNSSAIPMPRSPWCGRRGSTRLCARPRALFRSHAIAPHVRASFRTRRIPRAARRRFTVARSTPQIAQVHADTIRVVTRGVPSRRPPGSGRRNCALRSTPTARWRIRRLKVCWSGQSSYPPDRRRVTRCRGIRRSTPICCSKWSHSCSFRTDLARRRRQGSQLPAPGQRAVWRASIRASPVPTIPRCLITRADPRPGRGASPQLRAVPPRGM
jgi:hypothetical protein